MTELRKRISEYPQLRGLSERAKSLRAGSAATGRTLSQVTGPDYRARTAPVLSLHQECQTLTPVEASPKCGKPTNLIPRPHSVELKFCDTD